MDFPLVYYVACGLLFWFSCHAFWHYLLQILELSGDWQLSECYLWFTIWAFYYKQTNTFQNLAESKYSGYAFVCFCCFIFVQRSRVLEKTKTTLILKVGSYIGFPLRRKALWVTQMNLPTKFHKILYLIVLSFIQCELLV